MTRVGMFRRCRFFWERLGVPCFAEEPVFLLLLGCGVQAEWCTAGCRLETSLGAPLSRSSGRAGLPSTQGQEQGHSESL